MVLGSLGLIGAFAPALPAHGTGSTSPAPTGTGSNPFSTPASGTNHLAPGKSAQLGQEALAASHASHIPIQDVYLPNANHNTLPVSATGGHVEPLYAYAPAPMGLGYFGLTNTSGTTVPTILNTSSVTGTYSTNTTTGVQPFYLDNGLPDAYTVQLNSVLVNVNLNGSTTTAGIPNEFWTQNVMFYSAQLHQLQFIDNVWGFYPGLTATTFASHGPNGTQVGNVYYYALGPTINISYPFTAQMYLNSTIIGGNNAVFFNYTLSNASMTMSGSYDYVVFNSTGTAQPGVAVYQANGYQYDPIGLTNDFEIMIGGPGGGSQTDILAADATMTLSYWSATAHAYLPVPSAINIGGETGETSTGANVWYTGTTAHLTTGPSIVQGLWNMTGTVAGNPGFEMLHLNITPTNAFLFLQPGVHNFFGNNSTGAGPLLQWAPTIGPSLASAGWLRGVIPLAPGMYTYIVAFAEYSYAFGYLNLTNSSATISVHLSASDTGAYTPMFFWNNDQLANLSTSGNGTLNLPYNLYTQPNASGLVPTFASFNDYAFPVFPGAFFYNISEYVYFTPPSFTVNFSEAPYLLPAIAYFNLPMTNDLQTWIAYSTHIQVDSAFFDGWQPSGNSYALPANLIIWNSFQVLVSNNEFAVTGEGIFVYNGHVNYTQGFWGPNTNGPGMGNTTGMVTIWGNSFSTDPFYVGSCAFACSVDTTDAGIILGSNGDLIYNNVVATSFTAATLTSDFYSLNFVPMHYLDTWNISEQPATDVNYAPGFHGDSYALSGSIILTPYQGGNAWGNYGIFPNSFNVLPYTNSGAITEGGDYVPLSAPLYQVHINFTGIPANTTFTAKVTDTNANLYYFLQFTGPTNATILLPTAPNYLVGANVENFIVPQVPFSVVGASANVSVHVPQLYPIDFNASGFDSNVTSWQVSAYVNHTVVATNGTVAGNQVVLHLPNGNYTFQVQTSVLEIFVSPSAGNLTVNGTAVHIAVQFVPMYFTSIGATNLPTDVIWGVDFGGSIGTIYAVGTEYIQVYLLNGTYTVRYATPSPQFTPNAPTPALGVNLTFTVNGSGLTVLAAFHELFVATFSEMGLPFFDTWTVNLTGNLSSTVPAGTNATFSLPNGTYTYTVSTLDTDFQPGTATGTLTVAGANQVVSVSFHAVVTFVVNFNETGLPANTQWVVQLNGTLHTSTGPTISFTVPYPGFYGYAVSGLNHTLSPTPSAGTVFARTATTNVSITFAVPIPMFQVYFTASGIFPGTPWNVTFNGHLTNATGTTVGYTVTVGLYNYSIGAPAGFTVTPSSGTVNVTTQSISISLRFLLTRYTVSFNESGLPANTLWAVELGGVILGTTGQWINFSVAPGSYAYLVGFISGWTPNPTSGVVTVTNQTVQISIVYTPLPPVHVAPTAGASNDALARW